MARGWGGFTTTRQQSVGTCVIKPYLPIVGTVQGSPLTVMSRWISHLQCLITVFFLFNDILIIK